MPTTTSEPAGAQRDTERLRSDARANLDRVLAAAKVVFAEKGLDAKLADVARQAGVGVGTVYRRFATKDELIEELFRSRLAEVVSVATAAAAIDDPWRALVYFLEETTAMMVGDHGLRDLVLRGTPTPSCATNDRQHRLTAQVAQIRSEIHSLTADLVRRAQLAGVLRPDIEATDLPLLTMSVQTAADFAGPDQPELWRRMLGVVIDGLRVSRPTPTPLSVPALSVEHLEAALLRLHALPPAGRRAGRGRNAPQG